MQRMKMAGGMLVGAVVLHFGFMACSARNPTGMIGSLLDGGSRDTGILGGRDARAQEMPCTRWEVKFGPLISSIGEVQQVEAGWEPIGASTSAPVLRGCVAR